MSPVRQATPSATRTSFASRPITCARHRSCAGQRICDGRGDSRCRAGMGPDRDQQVTDFLAVPRVVHPRATTTMRASRRNELPRTPRMAVDRSSTPDPRRLAVRRIDARAAAERSRRHVGERIMTWLDELGDLTVIEAAEADDGIALITLNRPDRLNAITSTMIAELEAVVAAADTDPALRAVIVTGAGSGFCAGLDLQSQGVAPGAEGVRPTVAGFMWQDHLATLHERIHRSRNPGSRRSTVRASAVDSHWRSLATCRPAAPRRRSAPCS